MKAGRMGRRRLAGLAFVTSIGFVLTTGGPAGAQAQLRTELVNVNSAGQKAAGGPSTSPDVSDGGLSIAFQSRATNLVPGDT